MILYTLGTCGGIEHTIRRQHAAYVFEVQGVPYWFDAGAGCDRTGALSGVRLEHVRHIFISHPHRDHTENLANLYGSIRKTMTMRNVEPEMITLHLPDLFVWNCVHPMMEMTWPNRFMAEPHLYSDGTVFEDSRIRVEARHNFHIEQPDAVKFTSYSFRIFAEGKCVIYSGDVDSYADMGDWLNDCDLLLMESSHHSPESTCRSLREKNFNIRKLMFTHCGRPIIRDFEGERAKALLAWGREAFFAEDGGCYEI